MNNKLKQIFGADKPVIGMVHLLALPGNFGYEGDLDKVVHRALEDAAALKRGGAHGYLIENAGSIPFHIGEGIDVMEVAAMSRIAGGDPAGKIHRLLDFSGRPRDIADPWYTGDFDTTYDDIYEGCQCLLNHLITEGKIYGRKTK